MRIKENIRKNITWQKSEHGSRTIRYTNRVALVLLLCVFVTSICGANYSSENLAGTWHYQQLWIDHQMSYVGYTKGSGLLNGSFALSNVSSDEPTVPETATFASTIDPVGQVSMTSDGELVEGQMSASKDTIAFVNNVDGDFNFGILVKSATSDIWLDRGLNDDEIVVQWRSITNHLYTLHSSTNLSVGFSVLQSNIVATPPANRYTNIVDEASQRFWKVTREP